MSPVAAPADRRFRRAHVKPGRKRQWWSFAGPLVRYAAVTLVVLYGVYRATAFVADAHALQIAHIELRGNQWLSSGDVDAVLGDLRGQNIVWTDLDVWRQRLLASPWVKDATLRRSLPSTVEVTVFERMPMCIGRIDGSLYLVDDRGIVIDDYGPQYAEFDLPIVDGLGAQRGLPGALADPAKAALAAQLVASLAGDPAVSGRVSQIDVRDPQDVTVLLSGDPAVIHVGRERFLPRLQSYLQLAAAIHERVPEIDYVDLRFDERIYVRPAGKGRPIAAARSGR